MDATIAALEELTPVSSSFAPIDDSAYIRFARTSPGTRTPVLIFNAIGVSSELFLPLSLSLVAAGHSVVLWEYGRVGDDGDTFFSRVQSYKALLGHLRAGLYDLGLEDCRAVTLCNGASVLARLQAELPFAVSRAALISPYFNLLHVPHQSPYETALVPLLMKAATDEGGAARFVHSVLNRGGHAVASKEALSKAHMASPRSIAGYSRMLRDYRCHDETDVLRRVKGELHAFYCLDDEAVSTDYLEAIRSAKPSIGLSTYAGGGHYGIVDNPSLLADVTAYLGGDR